MDDSRGPLFLQDFDHHVWKGVPQLGCNNVPKKCVNYLQTSERSIKTLRRWKWEKKLSKQLHIFNAQMQASTDSQIINILYQFGQKQNSGWWGGSRPWLSTLLNSFAMSYKLISMQLKYNVTAYQMPLYSFGAIPCCLSLHTLQRRSPFSQHHPLTANATYRCGTHLRFLVLSRKWTNKRAAEHTSSMYLPRFYNSTNL